MEKRPISGRRGAAEPAAAGGERPGRPSSSGMRFSGFGEEEQPTALYSFRRNLGLAVLLCSAFLGTAVADGIADFSFNGFGGAAALTLTGDAMVAPTGLLYLTNTSRQLGRAFYPHPLRFKGSSSSSGSGGGAFSFSSNFVFAIFSTSSPPIAGHGMAFVISPTTDIRGASNPTTLGLLNRSEDGDARNHIAAVELDLLQNDKDIDDNHVGIDINSLKSISSAPAGYRVSATEGGHGFVNLSLSSGDPMQVWVEYDGVEKQLNVTLSPMSATTKPDLPLLSAAVDLSEILEETMYVGFSAATGKLMTSHIILGWTFKMNGSVRPLDLSNLPKLPKRGSTAGINKTVVLVVCSSILAPAAILAIAAGTIIILARRKRFSEIREDWEQEYGPHRFSYRDLFVATKGFGEEELLGIGGFGKVYRGVLPTSKTEVAVKKISHDSRQGMREFVAEIASIGGLRHRSLVQLLGYCRRKGELLLVYDYMPNGSLDRFLFDRERPPLDWKLRRRIIEDVASGLLYLHEGWEQVVIHRDIKASNVLLDGEFNGRVGDFGLARLYDHRTGPQTSTHVVGTMGYIAPELSNSCKFTTATDVFAFGAFLLEVAAGRRPIEAEMGGGEALLVDWVLTNWMKGEIAASADRRLRNEYPAEEMELVLTLGLLCSHPSPLARPSMRLVTQILGGDASLPEPSPDGFVASFQQWQKFDDFLGSYPSSIAAASSTGSLLSKGR